MPTPDRRPRMVTFIVAIAVLIAAPLAVVASENFTDVSDSNVHSADIDWLADNGVTLGCNPPDNDEFCPEDAVLRQQMASFMRRLAENQIVDAATAVDADNAAQAATAASADDSDTVGGLMPAEIAQGFAETGDTNLEPAVSGVNKLEEISMDAPSDGYVQLLGSSSVLDSNGGTALLWLQVDDTACDNSPENVGSVGFGYASPAGGNSTIGTGVAEGTVAVTPGAHTVSLCANFFVGAPSSPLNPSIAATFLKNATVTAGLASEDAGQIPGTR